MLTLLLTLLPTLLLSKPQPLATGALPLMVSSIVNDITNALLVVPPTKNNVVSEEA
jgi:hypothetical protein